ncbi:hypothetical protein P692DRAFT_20462354 [Suillus brevipes Sb2]|nr:hypothetical protein P692DRAFT_20462354 [Suillus brevipes Sb2]
MLSNGPATSFSVSKFHIRAVVSHDPLASIFSRSPSQPHRLSAPHNHAGPAVATHRLSPDTATACTSFSQTPRAPSISLPAFRSHWRVVLSSDALIICWPSGK